MVDIVLLIGKFLLLALLYLFLFAAVKTGVGLVRVSRSGPGVLALRVARGPREIMGVTVPVAGPIIIGRSPGSDIVIADDFVSSNHVRVHPTSNGVTVQDLGSTNGTVVNGERIREPVRAEAGDEIALGATLLKVVRL
ncbi:MAG: FHA domain-containing protein [Coriobacteriia bacterium]|nr:FHA domain-containing protein [Coriobacteriia bacterium]